jgi:hypothetical protein
MHIRRQLQRSKIMLQASNSSLPSIIDLLAKGKQAALTGQRDLAREMLAYVVYLDPRNAEGWLWLSGVVDFPQQVRYCLERTLRIDPNNQRARRGIEWLDARQKEIDEARAAAERVKPYWQTTKPKPLLNLIKGTEARTATGETRHRPAASWTSTAISMPNTRVARSHAPTTPVSSETLERITGSHPKTMGSYAQEVLADEDELSPRFVSKVALHNLLLAIKKVTGEPGTSAMLTMAGLEDLRDAVPPAEETPGANYTSFSALSEAMEEFYDHAVVQMETRVGREMFRQELANKGKMAAMKGVQFKLMSPEKKLRTVLEELADAHARMGMEAYFEEHEDGYLFALDTCPYCYGRLTNARCNVTAGFLAAGIEWATGRSLSIEEVTCRGLDESLCGYWIAL